MCCWGELKQARHKWSAPTACCFQSACGALPQPHAALALLLPIPHLVSKEHVPVAGESRVDSELIKVVVRREGRLLSSQMTNASMQPPGPHL